MAVKRKFTFPMSTLLYEANLILTAAQGQSAFVTKRLRTGLLTESDTLLTGLGGEGSSAQAQTAATGGLTRQQNDAITTMLDLFGKLKDSAKRAFAGDDVKLREEFQVGINEPNDLGSILDRAKKGRDAGQKTENVAPLKDKGGWITDDTTALDTAITAVGGMDQQQRASKTVQIAGTDARNTAANSLYDNLLTIQNAAEIEWPEREASNRATRDSFRMPGFPPSDRHKSSPPPAGGSSTPPATP